MLGIGGVMICAIIWGTTWYAITLQLGTVAPLASIVWRFGLAAAVLFIGCLVFRQNLRLTRAQHLAALAQGAFAFSISYSFTYASEAHVASAIVAVTFASLTFLNLVLFRLAAGQKAALASWGGALLGLAGVSVLSGGEVLKAGLDGEAALGVGLALVAVTASAFGNFFAWKGQVRGSAAIPSTAWAMAYGTGLLAIYGLVTGAQFTIDPSFTYVGSLLYLALFGSVIAFGLYFTIARTIGYAMASYVSALTPPIAMLVSVLFEGAHFGWTALAGLLLVLSGQALMIRAPKLST
ncbi:MAG: EamA family transporter [Alphaproteobacteria bacterium]|nr:EamA family transporter [Alphaproteobacteria bacterium]MBU3972918.1 EamA family transporter [Alphaproteobacteria bacterium]MBU4136490.1 EamA family transporter [Alphaproteobacteria bacterium]